MGAPSMDRPGGRKKSWHESDTSHSLPDSPHSEHRTELAHSGVAGCILSSQPSVPRVSSPHFQLTTGVHSLSQPGASQAAPSPELHTLPPARGSSAFSPKSRFHSTIPAAITTNLHSLPSPQDFIARLPTLRNPEPECPISETHSFLLSFRAVHLERSTACPVCAYPTDLGQFST